MKFVEVRKNHLILQAIIVFLIFAIVIHPEIYMQSVLNGLNVWLNSIVPALFPFLFLTKILTHFNLIDKISKKLEPLTTKLFNVSGISSYVFLMSIISGYPLGAKLTSDIFNSRKITETEAMRMCSFCSTSGPLFVIGTVGVSMLFSKTLGIIIFISHILGAILNGFIFRFYRYREKTKKQSEIILKTNVDGVLGNSMYDAIISVLMIGGYVSIFFLFIDILFNSHILSFCSNIIAFVCKFFNIDTNISLPIASGAVEMTRGLKDLSCLNLNQILTCIVATGIISFGGLSIQLQSLTFLKKCNIKIGLYFIMKLTQTFLSALIAFLFSLLFF